MYKSRKKHRLIGYDYSQAGYYFITICTNNRNMLFGEIQNKFGKIIPGSLGSIIRGYKIAVTKWFRTNTEILNVWQKSFYDEVIRTDKSLNNIREYIKNNPATWETEENRLLVGEVPEWPNGAAC